MGKFQDLTGNIYGELTVIERAEDYILPCGKHQTMWKCKCSCGKTINVRALQLKNGDSISCGHKHREIVSKKKELNPNVYVKKEDYYIVYTVKGEEFYFDIDDFEKVKLCRWYKDNRTGYLIGRKDGKRIFLHRMIMNVLDNSYLNIQVDHISGNRQDNRKNNLRLVTISQNGMNKKIQSNNTSGVTGVNYSKRDNKWRARIKINRNTIELGLFSNFEDAAKVRKDAEEKYFGEYSYDNSQKGKDNGRQIIKNDV